MALQPADLAVPGAATVNLLGALPAGGLTGSLPLTVESGAASPGTSLSLSKSTSVDLSWSASLGATSYAVHRCNATASPCSPVPVIASPVANSFADPVLLDGNNYWYTVDSVNSCGSVP